MRHVGFLLKRCKLVGCERPASYILEDGGGAICTLHAKLYAQGTVVAQKLQDEREARSASAEALNDLFDDGE